MYTFPEFLYFDAARIIEWAWKWFESVFQGFFNFLRWLLLSLFDVVQTILQQTPWFIWLFAALFVIIINFLVKKGKMDRKFWGWIGAISVVIIWVFYYNKVLSNPRFDIPFLNFLKAILTRDNTRTSWWIFVLLIFGAGNYLKNWKLGLSLSFLLFLIGAFGMWEPMTYTLAIIIIGVLISFVIGLPLGILMAKISVVEMILKPILDMMQTIPSFVYLIPAVMLFNQGRVPATFATVIYAVPPLIRLTFLGINNINAEVIEAGQAFGSTPMQMLRKIEIPQSLSTIATGLNQTTMMAVAMVVIASMIGAGGLGREVLIANRQIAVGDGFVAGFAIVFLAIILDRLLQGLTDKLEHVEGDIDG